MQNFIDPLYRVSPTHWSPQNGVHADYYPDGIHKIHVPYTGQTTLSTFTQPSYMNDQLLQNLGGTLKGY